MDYRKLLLPVAIAGVTFIGSNGVAVGASRGPSLAGAPFLTPVPAAVNTRDPGTELLDGGFETSLPDSGGWLVNDHWSGLSTNWSTPFCDLATCAVADQRSGNFWTWFAWGDLQEVASVSQTAIIPAGSAALYFYLAIPDCNSSTYSLNVNIDGVPVWGFDQSNPPFCGSKDYMPISVDISGFADGLDHDIEFAADIAADDPATSTNFYIDDVAITEKYSYFRPAQANLLPPPDADCATADHYGRMIVDTANGDLWMCNVSGWMNVLGAP